MADKNLKSNNISLSIEGREVIAFDSLKYQQGYNSLKNEFRVYDDDLKNGFIIQCNEAPLREDQQIGASLNYFTSGGEKKTTTLTFEIQKISADGKIWFWNKKQRIGAIVHYKP